MTAIGTALSGMQTSLARLTASASNIANANSTGAPNAAAGQTQAYQPVRVQTSPTAGGGVAATTVSVTPTTVPRYDPTSPNADASGMVAAPNVDVASEMVEQLSAKIAYEANLKVMRTADRMGESTLEAWG